MFLYRDTGDTEPAQFYMSTYTCERTKLYYKSEIPNLVGYTIEIEPVAEEEVVEEEAIPTCSDG